MNYFLCFKLSEDATHTGLLTGNCFLGKEVWVPAPTRVDQLSFWTGHFTFSVLKAANSEMELVLNGHVCSLELSDPFTEPLYEKVLRSVKDLKSSVTSIVKAQGKTCSVGGQ